MLGPSHAVVKMGIKKGDNNSRSLVDLSGDHGTMY